MTVKEPTSRKPARRKSASRPTRKRAPAPAKADTEPDSGQPGATPYRRPSRVVTPSKQAKPATEDATSAPDVTAPQDKPTEAAKPKAPPRKTPAKRAATVAAKSADKAAPSAKTRARRGKSPATQKTAPQPAPASPSRTARQQPLTDEGPETRYRRWLLWFHETFLRGRGQRFERLPTHGVVDLADLDIQSVHRALAYPDRPSPARLVHWVIEAVLADGHRPQTMSFVDVGSGRGRAILEASRFAFREIVGVEFTRELHEAALVNLRHWPRWAMACRDVTLVHGDAAHIDLPRGDLLIYLFRPFTERVTTAIARKAVDAARDGAAVYVAAVDPKHTLPLRESQAFETVELAPRHRRRFSLFSPYGLELYRAKTSA